MASDTRPSRAATGRKALQAFLRTHWTGGGHFLGIGGYDPKRLPDIDARTLCALMRIVRMGIDARDWERAEQALSFLPLFAELLAQGRFAGHAPRLADLEKAVGKRSADKAALHHTRLTNILRLVAADFPVEDGQRVAVKRTRHGWHDGGVVGTVRPGSGGTIVDGDDGQAYEIEHRRDIR